jgi:acetamidase/formamidase
MLFTVSSVAGGVRISQLVVVPNMLVTAFLPEHFFVSS